MRCKQNPSYFCPVTNRSDLFAGFVIGVFVLGLICLLLLMGRAAIQRYDAQRQKPDAVDSQEVRDLQKIRAELEKHVEADRLSYEAVNIVLDCQNVSGKDFEARRCEERLKNWRKQYKELEGKAK